MIKEVFKWCVVDYIHRKNRAENYSKAFDKRVQRFATAEK